VRAQALAATARKKLQSFDSTKGSSPTHMTCPQREVGLRATRNAGIHALEVYVPRHCVSAAELERTYKVEGKYTIGLMMREWAACDEDEDVVSMALTVVHRLMERYGVGHGDVGMLQVGSESLLDRSKSIKTHPKSAAVPP